MLGQENKRNVHLKKDLNGQKVNSMDGGRKQFNKVLKSSVQIFTSA